MAHQGSRGDKNSHAFSFAAFVTSVCATVTGDPVLASTRYVMSVNTSDIESMKESVSKSVLTASTIHSFTVRIYKSPLPTYMRGVCQEIRPDRRVVTFVCVRYPDAIRMSPASANGVFLNTHSQLGAHAHSSDSISRRYGLRLLGEDRGARVFHSWRRPVLGARQHIGARDRRPA